MEEALNLSLDRILNDEDELMLMLVQVYVDNSMKKTAVYMWMKCFSEGR